MKLSITVLLLLWQWCAIAQLPPPYPSGNMPAGNIVAVEYFFNTDPGIGQGISIPVSPSANIIDLSPVIALSGSALAQGVHKLGVRAMDAEGHWSHTHYRVFDNIPAPAYPVAPPPAATITAVEYFIDQDPGIGAGVPIPVTAAGDIALPNVWVDVTGLSSGIHQVFFRSRDAAGRWSLTHVRIFDNLGAAPYPSAPAPAPAVGELEYFIDNDPGQGNGTAIPITPGTDIAGLTVTIPVTGLAQGPHTLFIRSRQNPWSFTSTREFNLGGSLPLTWLYFNGRVSGDDCLLDWGTTNEVDTDKFLVEHATDGSHYTVLGTVASRSAGTGVDQRYAFKHEKAGAGIHYYRLRQVDKNGQYTYSRVVPLLVRQSMKTDLAFPNPARQFLHIALAQPVEVTAYELMAPDGRSIKRVQLQKGPVSQVTIDLSGIGKGMYVARIWYAGKAHAFPFFKE